MTNKQLFLRLVSLNALAKDIRLGKALCSDVAFSAAKIPTKFLNKTEYGKDADELILAKDWVAYEYAVYEESDDIPQWIKNYLDSLKQENNTSLVSNKSYFIG